MNEQTGRARSAEELKREFDSQFAEAPTRERPELVQLIGVRVGSEAYAVRLAQMAEIVASRTVIPIPSASDRLVGLAGLHGKPLAVYSLARILRVERRADERWFAVARTEEMVAFAFEELEGHFLVPHEEIADPASGGPDTHSALQSVRIDGLLRPIIDLDSEYDRIKENARHQRE